MYPEEPVTATVDCLDAVEAAVEKARKKRRSSSDTTNDPICPEEPGTATVDGLDAACVEKARKRRGNMIKFGSLVKCSSNLLTPN
jgi:hypothetical protein